MVGIHFLILNNRRGFDRNRVVLLDFSCEPLDDFEFRLDFLFFGPFGIVAACLPF